MKEKGLSIDEVTKFLHGYLKDKPVDYDKLHEFALNKLETAKQVVKERERDSVKKKLQ